MGSKYFSSDTRYGYGALHHFTLTTIGSQYVDEAFTFSITAEDENFKKVESFSGSVVISSTGTLSSGSGATSNFTSGSLANHSVSISNAGTFTITASGSVSGTSNEFDVLEKLFTVVSSVGSNGTISPLGEHVVVVGSDVLYTITPITGYEVDDVLVDSISVGAVTNYAFSSIDSDHTIAATFKVKMLTITSSVESGGTISPLGETEVVYGGTQQYTITADAGYEIAGVVVDGVNLGVGSMYEFAGVIADHTITAAFWSLGPYSIFSSAVNGTITPEGETEVAYGGTQAYSFSADANYHITDVLIDGVSVGTPASYTFTNVVANHTIEIICAINTYTITASTGSNGTVTPLGVTTVNYGGSLTLSIVPNTNYLVSDVLVDSVSVGAVTSYTFSSVAGNHTISATFAVKPGAILDHFDFTTIDAQQKSTEFQFAVFAQDVNNVPVTSFTGSVNITSTGTLSSGSGATPNFANGVLEERRVKISNAGTFTITATSGSVTGTSNSFVVGSKFEYYLAHVTQSGSAAPVINSVIHNNIADGNFSVVSSYLTAGGFSFQFCNSLGVPYNFNDLGSSVEIGFSSDALPGQNRMMLYYLDGTVQAVFFIWNPQGDGVNGWMDGKLIIWRYV